MAAHTELPPDAEAFQREYDRLPNLARPPDTAGFPGDICKVNGLMWVCQSGRWYQADSLNRTVYPVQQA